MFKNFSSGNAVDVTAHYRKAVACQLDTKEKKMKIYRIA
jgi:hypothetical protein